MDDSIVDVSEELPPGLQDPVPPPPPAPPPPPPPPEPVEFPANWLLTNAPAPIQYRVLRDILEDGEAAAQLESAVIGYPPAFGLALLQNADGSWGSTMLGTPTTRAKLFEGVGTANAVRRLLECGWDREIPTLVHARRLLFRLLAEDEDPALAFEFLPAKLRSDPNHVQRGRRIVQEAAAMVLAQAGYEQDPRLRGAARRMLERIGEYLHSPLAEKPWIRVGNKQVLAPEASPPSIFALWTFAFMTHFRSEFADIMDRLLHHLTQPLPRQQPVQVVGDELVDQPHLVLGDELPHRNAFDADVPKALAWLELMARLGFLKRTEHWMKLLDRSLADRDADRVWHPHKGMAAPRTSDSHTWAYFPLDPGNQGEDRWTDVTFRLGLIAKLAGRPIIPV